MKKLILILVLMVFSVSAKTSYPPIVIKVLGDGKPIANALVYGRFFVAGYDNCSNPLVELGKTGSDGRLIISTKKDQRFYLNLCRAGKCKSNNYKSPFGGCIESGVELRVTAQGYRSAKEKGTYTGFKSQLYGYIYNNVNITVFLDRL